MDYKVASCNCSSLFWITDAQGPQFTQNFEPSHGIGPFLLNFKVFVEFCGLTVPAGDYFFFSNLNPSLRIFLTKLPILRSS